IGEDKQRTHVLFVEENEIQPSFDVPLKELPPPPLPSVEEVLAKADQTIQGVEEENLFNRLLGKFFPRGRRLQVLVVTLALAAAVYGGYRLSRARYRVEQGVPLLATSLAQNAPAAAGMEQRHQAMLGENNLGEAARSLTRQWWEAALGDSYPADGP